ncbi:MAG: hypothetical protein GXP62_10560 [Oligoflexia bacterium]|nr:hypothetical protein [Oligoflexia bacterium]
MSSSQLASSALPPSIRAFLLLTAALLPQTAWAFDDEPNDSCSSADAVTLSFSDTGGLSDASDVDYFQFTPGRDGMLSVDLENLTNPDDDFTLEATDATTSAVVDSASTTAGHVGVIWAATGGTSYCLDVDGGEGGYSLSASFALDPPVIDQIQDATGTAITSAFRGDSVTIVGQDFIADPDDVVVIFDGALAAVDSLSDTEIDVVIPANAVDGTVYVIVEGRMSSGYDFSVGETTAESPLDYTAPDGAYFSGLPANPVFLNRTFVTFDPALDRTGVEAVLDDVATGVSAWSGWSVVGALPMLNGFQVEWTFADPTVAPDLDDLYDVMGALSLEADITSVSPEGVYKSYNALTLASDYDLLYANSTQTGAMAQISLPEARRLLRFSGLSSLSADPGMVIFDSGLYFGTGWTGPGLTEFPSDYFTLLELDDSGTWGETAAPGHASLLIGSVNHGNETASVVAGKSQGDPDWLDGTARSNDNMSGIWASLDLFGINDDAAFESGAGIETDEPGEAITHSVVVVNDHTLAGADTSGSYDSTTLFLYGLANTVWNTSMKDWVFAIPQGLNMGKRSDVDTDKPATSGADEGKYNQTFENLVAAACARHVFVMSSGNDGKVVDTVPELETTARWLKKHCGDTSLLVGGTYAGGYGTGADQPAVHSGGSTSRTGHQIDIAAPFDAWRLAGASWNIGAGAPQLSFESGRDAFGNSYSGPAVAAAVGLRQAILPDESAKDRRTGVLENSDDISSITTDFGALSTGLVPRLNLFEVVYDALFKAESLPLHRTQVRVYAADAVDQVLLSQVVDPTTGVRDSGTLVSTNVSLDGCNEPMDVAIHPLGDVVYVLCGDSAQIAAYTATDLDYVGSVDLEGVVGGSAELVMLPSGVLYVTTRNASGAMVVEAFDTWTGAREAPTALLWDTFSTSTPVGAGGAAHPDGTAIALMVSDYITTGEDYDVMVKITPDHDDVDKGTSVSGGDTTYDLTNVESLVSVSGTRNARDLDWMPDGSAALGVFNRASGGGYAEIV